MTFSSIGDANKFKDIQIQLEKQSTNNKSHLGVIKQTSDDLFALFDSPDTYTEINESNGINHEEDLKKLDTVFQEKIDLLEKPQSISSKSIDNRYKEYNTPGIMLNPKDTTKIKLDLENIYEKGPENFKPFFKSLPITSKFRTDIRKKYFSGIEKRGTIDETELGTICTGLQVDGILKTPSSPELDLKLTKLLLLVAQVDQFIETGALDTHLTGAKSALTLIRKTLRQLESLNSLHKTKGKIEERLSNFEGIDHMNPAKLSDTMAGVEKESITTIQLEDVFVDKTKIDQIEKEYTINEISIIDSKKNNVPIFANINGDPIPSGLKNGSKQELFLKEGTEYISIGNCELKDKELVITTSTYSKLPDSLQPPFSYNFNIQGLAGTKGTLTAPVAITKNLSQNINKPIFDAEYNDLENDYKINEKLSLIFDEQYESQLKERFYEILESNPQSKDEWPKLTDDQKNDFFQTVIAGGTPTRSNGMSVPAELTKAACYTKAEYHADIKKRILKGFTGKTKTELKKYIFEKLGTLDFTELGKNPYAIKVLADSIRDKMNSKVDDAYYLLNQYALATRFAKTHIAPEELLPDGSKAGEKELDAVVADSKELFREGAYEKAQKQLEDYYKSGARFGLKRAKVFFFRGRMIEKAIAKDLKTNKGMHIDKNSNSAVNRWMLEQAMGGEFAENIRENTTVFDDPVFQDRLNDIVEKYLKNPDPSADSNFASDIQSLIMSNSQLKVYMKDQKITHLGTNLVEQAKAEKEERNYYGQLINTINQYTTDSALNKPQEFEVAIRKQLADFAQKQNRLPDMIKQLNLNVDDVNFAEKIANHKITLERMKMRNVKLRLRLLTNKNENEKGLTTAQDVNRDKFDATYGKKLTKWMEKHPWWTTSLTAVGLVAGGIVGTLTTPVLGVGIGAAMLWHINFLKKRGHYTEEHKKFEQHILAMTPNEREKYLEDMKEKSEKLPKALRFWFSDQYTKYGKSMEYITITDSVEKTMGDLDRYINKPTMLDTTEKGQFGTYLKDAITLLEMHKTQGRNFIHGEKGKAELEEIYNKLHQKVVAGLRRFDGTKNPEDVISSLTASVHSNVTDLQDEYDENKKDMKGMRTKLGIFSGTKSAAIYLGTAWLGGLIRNEVADGWNHLFGNNGATPGTPAVAPTPGSTTVSSTVGLDTAFGTNAAGAPDGHLLLQNVFNNDAAKYQQLVDKLQNLPAADTQTTLRDTLKDIFGTNQIATAKTHQIFNQFAANISDKTTQELITQGANVNLHSAQQIGTLMTNRGYSGITTDPSQIQSLISGLKNGAFDINNLPVGWTKETACNALFCNTQGHQLTDLFFDTFKGTVTTPGIPGVPGTPGFPGAPTPLPINKPSFLNFGLPTFFNEIRNKK